MSNAILPRAAVDRRASPVMPLFLRGGALGSAAPFPRPRCPRSPGGGTGSPSAVAISSLCTQPLSPPRYSIVDVSGIPACELLGYPCSTSHLSKSPCAFAYTSSQKYTCLPSGAYFASIFLATSAYV